MVSQINMLAWVGMRERSRHSGREQPHGDREGCQPLLTPFGMPISRVHSNAVGNGGQLGARCPLRIRMGLGPGRVLARIQFVFCV